MHQAFDNPTLQLDYEFEMGEASNPQFRGAVVRGLPLDQPHLVKYKRAHRPKEYIN